MENKEDIFLKEINDLLEENAVDNFEKYITNLKSKNIFIYGCGNAGISTYNILKKFNIEIEGFIDKKANNNMFCMGKKVCKIQNLSPNRNKNDIIIISFLCNYDELKKFTQYLNNKGFEDICYFHDIYNSFIVNSSILEENYYSDNKESIIKAYKALNDFESKKIFTKFLKGIVCFDSNQFIEVETGKIQYFPKDINLNYLRVVDCGAFDGDTARELKKQMGYIVEALACFEPDIKNFNSLCESIRNEKVAKEQILIPCGTYDKNKIIKFSAGCSGSSEISDYGDECIQVVKIDDILMDFKPTFIKMDIEGSEYKSIIGAEKIIKENLPDLAICIYHRIEDLWRIILLIKKYSFNYKFYLRTYGVHGMETVLYATCNNY